MLFLSLTSSAHGQVICLASATLMNHDLTLRYSTRGTVISIIHCRRSLRDKTPPSEVNRDGESYTVTDDCWSALYIHVHTYQDQ